VVTVTGWTWDQALDTLTVPRFLALREHWRLRPPAHWLLAWAFRYSPKTAEPAPARPSVRELEAMLPGGRL